MEVNEVQGLRFGLAGRNDNNLGNNRRNVNVNQPSNGSEMTPAFFRASDDFMRTYCNLFQSLCSFDNLFLAYQNASRHKRKKDYILEFEKDLENNLYKLQWELLTHTYLPRPLKTFTVRDPKTRKISAASFRDRVIHHALCNTIAPIFESRFIHDTYANRKGKGTLAALNRFDFFVRKVSGNGKPICRVRESQILSQAIA